MGTLENSRILRPVSYTHLDVYKRQGLDIAAPLCLEDGAGRPTAELDAAYFRTKETNP